MNTVSAKIDINEGSYEPHLGHPQTYRYLEHHQIQGLSRLGLDLSGSFSYTQCMRRAYTSPESQLTIAQFILKLPAIATLYWLSRSIRGNSSVHSDGQQSIRSYPCLALYSEIRQGKAGRPYLGDPSDSFKSFRNRSTTLYLRTRFAGSNQKLQVYAGGKIAAAVG